MNIILLGYRGSGKSTIGKLLANHLWKTFVDTDTEVCKRFDPLSIAEIWEQLGEDQWRRAEAEVTQDVCGRSDVVIALGGGAVMHPQGRQAIEQAQEATRIYLRCDPEELHRRITYDSRTEAMRPHLTGLGGGVDEIHQVLKERDPVYQALADHVFDVTHVRPDNCMTHLMNRCLR